MNTSHRPTKEPDDHDIAALLDAQQFAVPDELDAAILAVAKEAVTELPASTSRPVTEATPATKPLSKTTNRWFALAATIVVGVSVAPLLLQAPESSLDAPTAPTAAPVELIAESAQQVASKSNGGAAGDLVNEESESIAASDESAVVAASEQSLLKKSVAKVNRQATIGATMESDSAVLVNAETTATARSRIASSAAPAASIATFSTAERSLLDSNDNKHRNTADAWMKEILRLNTAGNIRQASVEYKLFRTKHPDFKPDFRPEFKPQFDPRSQTNDPTAGE